MTTLDLRPVPQDDHRETVFERLDEIEVGEMVSVATDRDLEVLLHQYLMKRATSLRWESTRLDDDGHEVRITKAAPAEENSLADFDVRDMPPQQRHEVLTDTFDRLDPGEGFVLVNDHDPKPLYHELRSTRGDVFEWEYTSRDPQEWRVEIVKTDDAEAVDEGVVASFDVREIPKQERHPTIHHRYGNIADGETMAITAPHEPQPLHREFQQRYGESFSWEVVENEPGRCRVHITKRAEEDSRVTDNSAPVEASNSIEVTEELDVRDLPPAERHEQIFEAYADLKLGKGFVLVNDHDPKPLYHQFDAEAGDEFHWEYRQQEPGAFRVLIAKVDVPESETNQDASADAPF